MVPPRRRAAPVKPEDAELDKRGMSRLKSVADSGPPTVGALRGRGRGWYGGGAPPRGGRGRGRGRGGGGGGGLPPSVRAPPSSSSRSARPPPARPSYYSTSTDSSYYANVPRDSGYRPRPRPRSPSPDRARAREKRRDSTPPPLLPPAPPSPRRYRPASPDSPTPPSPPPASDDDGQEMPYDYTLLRPAADQRWGEEESFNRRYSPSRGANIPLPPPPIASTSRSPEVAPRKLQHAHTPIVVDDDDGPELTPQPETSKAAATGPNVPPRFKPRNPNPRPNTRSSAAAAAPPPPTTASAAAPRALPLSARAAGKQPARPDVKPPAAALREVLSVEASAAGPAIPRTEGVLALRNDAFPPGCLGPASAARRAARTTWMRKLKQDLADEGRTAVSFKWRDDGLAIDWVVTQPAPAHNPDDDDNDDYIEIVAPPPPVRAPTPISIASSPEPENDENDPRDRLPTLTPDSPMPDHREEPIVTRSQSTPRKEPAPAAATTKQQKKDERKAMQAAIAAESNITEAEWLGLSNKQRDAFLQLNSHAKRNPEAKEELGRLAAQIAAEGAEGVIKPWYEARRAATEERLQVKDKTKSERQELKRAAAEKRQAEAEKRKAEVDERKRANERARRSKLTWCSMDDMSVPPKEKGIVSTPLPHKYRDPASRKSDRYREWAARIIDPCRHLSGDGFVLNKVDSWIQDGKLYTEWGPFTAEELEEQALNLLGDDSGPAPAQPPAPVPPAPPKRAPADQVEKQATPRRSVSPIKRAADRRSLSPARKSPRQQEGDVRARTPEAAKAPPSSPPYSPSNPIQHDAENEGDTSIDTAGAGESTKRPRTDSFAAHVPPSPTSPAVSSLAPAESPIEHTGWAPCSPPPPAKRARLGSHEPFTQRESGWYPHSGWGEAVPEVHEKEGMGVEVNGVVEEARAEAGVEAEVEAETGFDAEAGVDAEAEPEAEAKPRVPAATPMAAETKTGMETVDAADAATVSAAPAIPALLPAQDTSRGPSPAAATETDITAPLRSASASLSVSGETVTNTPPPPGAGTSHLSPRERYAELSARMERLFDTIDRWTRLMDKHPHRADGLRRQIERTEADIFALQNEMDAAQAEAEAEAAGGIEGAEAAILPRGKDGAEAAILPRGKDGVDTGVDPDAATDTPAHADEPQRAPTDPLPPAAHDAAPAADHAGNI